MSGDEAGAAADPRLFALLCRCLRLDHDGETVAALRAEIAAAGWNALIDAADGLRLTSALVDRVRALGLTPPIPPITLPGGRVTISLALAQMEAAHDERRSVLAARLTELAAALASAGIPALVLKGGRSLVTGNPAWRHLRDIDLLVAPHEAVRAQAIAMGLGYRAGEQPKRRLLHHHLHELYRDDMPGWIEIHRYGGPSRLEQFVPSRELLAAAETMEVGEARIGVLPQHLHILHSLLHHHIGHRGVTHSAIPPKALYEFAAEVGALDEPGRAKLIERASLHPRVLAILELWLAAAADRFGLLVKAPLTIPEDSVEWWSAVRDDPEADGSTLEKRAAVSEARLRRARGGESGARRAIWRLTTPLTFLRRPTLPMPGWPRR